jgi:hypothetical protein
MKSKKSKQKEVKNKKIQKEKGINEIENDILSSPKNINLFNKLIEIFINNIENKDEEKIREIMNSLKNILTYFLKNENVKSSNELITFLNDKIQLIYKIILDSIFSSDIDEDESFLPIIFHILYELINFIPEDKVNSLFNDFISKLISIEKEISPGIINSFYEQFNTISYYNYIFNSFLDILTSKKIKNQNEFNNFYFFVTNINDLDSLLEINDNNLNNEDDERKLNELKEKYQNIIINFVNEKLLPLSLIKEFMKILNKKIVQNVVNPIIFSDYLLNKTNEIKIKSINDFDIQIFGLSSLFVLLTKYNLDYDKYYELLYKLISQKFNGITIFDSKHKNRILKLLELSLTSEQIPYIVICSFLKKLLRISLFSKVEIIYSLLSLVMKIIQLHPRTLNLIMDNKSKKILKKNIESNSTFLNGSNANENNLDEIKNCISLEEEDEEKSNNIINYDNFDESSTDPFKTNAEQCCLWELYSFTRHYNMGIRKLVNKFSRNFLAKEIEMELKSQKDVYFDIKNLNSHFYINN